MEEKSESEEKNSENDDNEGSDKTESKKESITNSEEQKEEKEEESDNNNKSADDNSKENNKEDQINNEENNIKKIDSYNSFGLKQKEKEEENKSEKNSNKSENGKKDKRKEDNEKKNNSENEDSEEEEDEEEEDEEEEEEEDDEEENENNNKKMNNKKKKNESESDSDDSIESEGKKELKINTRKVNEQYISNNKAKTLRNIFNEGINEGSITRDDLNLKEGNCDRNNLAIIFLEILLNSNENINILFNRPKFKSILDSIKQNKNYFEIFKSIGTDEYKNQNLFQILKDNKQLINKPLLLVTINPNEQIEVEFYKYGKTFTSSIRKRFGIIINCNFYSSTQPLEKFNDTKAKNKTKYILNSKQIYRENLDGNENEYDKKVNIWHNENKPYRIRINYLTDKNKMSSFFIYCEGEKERNEIFQLIKLTQMTLNIKESSDIILKKMQKSINRHNIVYAIIKILTVKKKLKNKKIIKRYINHFFEKDKKKFNNFLSDIKNKISQKFIEQRKFFYKKGINRDMKHLILNSKYLKNINDNKENNNNNIDNIKKSANIIYNLLKKSYGKVANSYNSNLISLKVKEINKNISNIDLCFNYKDICINSINSNSTYLSKEQIFDISNVIYNFSYNIDNSKEEENNVLENDNKKFNVLILGPYLNSGENYFNEGNIYYDIKIPKNKSIKNAYDRLTYNKKTNIDYIICQIFNCEINKSEIKNFNFASSIKEEDYFFLKIIGGKNNNCNMQTKLYNPKIIRDNLIILEFNVEFVIPYEFFNNKNEEIKIVLYHITKINISKINLLDKTIIDYINKNEIKGLSLNLNMIKNRSYETLFDQCVKSKIFWNLIPFYQNKININNINNNKTYQYKKIPYYSKSLKIGDKFYYLENINQEKISTLINNKDIPNYYKYEVIERYLQNLNYYHEKNKSKVINASPKNILNFNKDSVNKEINLNDVKEVKGGLLNLCEYLGINENEEIFFHNLFTNEYKCKKYDENSFIIIQNNSFNIINNEEMYNFNKDTNEKFIYSFQWYKLICFKNEIQMLSFIEILKKLRRLSVNNLFNTKNIIAQEINPFQKIPEEEIIFGKKINADLLYDILKEDDQSKNNFNIIINLSKIELKNDFDIDYNSIIDLEIISKSTELDIKNEINLLETFFNNMNKYNNKFIQIIPRINSLKMKKINTNEKYKVLFTNKIRLSQEYFNSQNNKIIHADLLPENEKIINIDIDIVKDNIIHMNFFCQSENAYQNMYSNFDINKDIFNSLVIKTIIQENSNNRNYNYNNIFADFLILPIYLKSENENNILYENIIGILTLELTCINYNNYDINNIDINSYNYLYNKLISDYIYICFIKGNSLYGNGYYNDKLIVNNDIPEKKQDIELINILGTFEPNIFKNVIVYKIFNYYKISLAELINNNDYEKINKFINLKGINNQEYIPNLNDYNSKYLFNKLSKYLFKYKRNSFYNYFTESSWKKLLINLSNNNNIPLELINYIYYYFPSKEKLIIHNKRNDNLFYNIRDLIYMGLPNVLSRKIIWDKLLNINDLVNKTANKLSDFKIYNITTEDIASEKTYNTNEYNKEKGEIYTLLSDITKNNFLDEYFSIMDTIIDLDIMNLKDISKNDYNNFELIKQITKTFYQWTFLNIGSTSEANAINKASEIQNINEIKFSSLFNISNRYCYYSGIVYLCDKLFKYFKSPSETFWYLVGLSQVIPMFNANYNSYELSIYILVIKLILEHHHSNLYNKLISLNFPFEYFLSTHISSYYSSFFSDINLFMKISDILIFESSIAKNNNEDSINHLRFLCSIALTIFVENENKFLSVDNIFQLENLFKILKFKTYNNQLFFQKIYNNISIYFINSDSGNKKTNSQKYDLYSVINNKWDDKRKKIEKILDENYYSYIKNNYKYMEKKFKDLSLIILNKYTNIEKSDEDNSESIDNLNDNTNRININIWKYIIRNYLESHAKKIENVQKKDSNRGVLMILREIKIMNFDRKKIFFINGKFNIECYSEKGKGNKIYNKIFINEKGLIYNINNSSECLINFKYSYKDNNILLFSLLNENNREIFRFKLNINNINLLKPLRLQIHSFNSFVESNFAILEISILKYNDFILNDDYCNLYLSLFSPNDYTIDNVIKQKLLEINNTPKINIFKKSIENEEENICKNISNNYHEKLPLIYQFYLDKYFLFLKKSFKEKLSENTYIEIKKIINELFVFNNNEKSYIDDIVKWFKDEKEKYNGMTIMEILIYLYLDNNIMNQNGNDILYNLFCFSSLNNKRNIVTISSIIELVYSLYKKYSIYFPYNEVASMVNYFFQKEKYPSIKSVLLCNFQDIDKIREIIHNKNRYDIKNKVNNINDIINYIDITDNFIYVMKNFEEICKIYDINDNKLDMNPQSKNNVILILKIVIFNLFFLDKKNNNNSYDYNLYDFIVIEYLKEFTNEEFYFSFELNLENNTYNISFIDNDKKYSNAYENLDNNSFGSNIELYEAILLYSNNNFLFNNTNTDYIEYDISFYEFKKLFFHLPYLTDLIWKNCHKLNTAKLNENTNIMKYKSISNKIILYDRVNINIINNQKKIVQFIFVSNLQTNNRNLNYSINFSHSYNSIIINYNIYSNFIIKKLYDIINDKMQYQDLKKFCSKDNNFENDIQTIKDSLSDFNNMIFYSINSTYNYNYSINYYNDYLDNNSKFHFLEPLLPLYINFNYSELKNNTINFNIDITYSFLKKNHKISKNKGYAKFPLNYEIDFYQWRKCSIMIEEKSDIEKNYKIKFDCFNKLNKNEQKMRKLFINNEEGGEDNYKEKYTDILFKEDEKNIGKNILINRNNNYKCL